MTDLIKKETNEVTTSNSGIPQGMENAELENVAIPTAKLLQSNSPEVTDEDFADYGFRAGKIIHSLLLEEMPESFIPIMVVDTNTLFVPRNDADKMIVRAKVKDKFGIELTENDMDSLFLCRAKDGRHGDKFGNCFNCKLNRFSGNEKPICTANINVLALFDGQDMPVIIRFSNTSYKHGNKFKTLLMYSGGAVFSKKYKLQTMKKSGNGNTWYEMKVAPAGKPTEEEFNKAKALYEQFIGTDLGVETKEETSVSEDTPF